jgi:hypothetical protein
VHYTRQATVTFFPSRNIHVERGTEKLTKPKVRQLRKEVKYLEKPKDSENL